MTTKDNACSCARCRRIFAEEDMIVEYIKIFGIDIATKCCPFCGSSSYTALRDLDYLNSKRLLKLNE